MSVRRHQRDWEELAEVDPLWAVLSDPARRGGRWRLDEFLATGEDDAERVLRVAAELGRPARRERVLDFGCGIGRVTRAFAAHFEEALGVDVAMSLDDCVPAAASPAMHSRRITSMAVPVVPGMRKKGRAGGRRAPPTYRLMRAL